MYHCENGVCYLTSYEPCKNYIVCKNKLSQNEQGEICNDCYHIFGEWRERQRANVEIKTDCDICPLCQEENQKIVFRMDCDHLVCVDCFRKIYFGLEIKKPVLSFSDKSLLIYKQQLEKWNRINELYKNNYMTMKCNSCDDEKIIS